MVLDRHAAAKAAAIRDGRMANGHPLVRALLLPQCFQNLARLTSGSGNFTTMLRAMSMAAILN